jgi:hypothetical protein
MKLILEIDDLVASRLAVLVPEPRTATRVEQAVMELIDHAQQGVYRSGAWERSWLMQAFGDDWLELIEPDPDVDWAVGHDRPRSVTP